MAKKKNYSDPIDITLFVPDIGDKITLEEDWNFRLNDEYRNREFMDDLKKAGLLDNSEMKTKYQEFLSNYSGYLKTTPSFGTFLGDKDKDLYDLRNNILDTRMIEDIRNDLYYSDKYVTTTIPDGCEIFIDRVYIRKGASDYSSITFRVEGMENMPKKSYRFWVKLHDTRGIKGKYQVLIREG